MNLIHWVSMDKAAMWHHCGFRLMTPCSSDNEHLKAAVPPLSHIHILEIKMSEKKMKPSLISRRLCAANCLNEPPLMPL